MRCRNGVCVGINEPGHRPVAFLEADCDDENGGSGGNGGSTCIPGAFGSLPVPGPGPATMPSYSGPLPLGIPCPPIAYQLGACCLPGGNCVETSESECIDQGGVYMGDGTSCTPNPCL
jgi:hypothetical protein